jgi:hypothetical protein
MFRTARLARFDPRCLSATALERLSMAAILFYGAWEAWVYKFKPYSDDAVSYLDVSDSVVAGHLRGVLNEYWSPLYPVLIGIMRVLVRPSAYWEFAALKLVNLALLVFALFSFRWFLRELVRWQRSETDAAGVAEIGPSERQWIAIGFCLFAWAALVGTHLMANTPDLGWAGFVFLAIGLALRASRGPASPALVAGLGAVLGAGYLCKAIVLPLACVIIPVTILHIAGARRRAVASLSAVIGLLVLAGPLVLALSWQAHGFTVGQAGRLNYLWYVERVADHNWSGQTPDGRTADHPARQISVAPHAYEFDGPVGGTYPQWTDPAYWYAGLHPRLALRNLAVLVARNAVAFWRQFGLIVISGWLALLVASGLASGWWRRLWRASILVIPAIAGLTMFAAVYDFAGKFEARHVAPFVVLGTLGLLTTVRARQTPPGRRIFSAVALVALVIVAQGLADRLLDDVRILRATSNDAWTVAEGLRAAGLREGDRVAHLGDRGYYWARVLRLRIVAEIPDPDEWWALPADARRALADRLEHLGIRAIVQRPGLPVPLNEPAWQRVPGNAYVLILK